MLRANVKLVHLFATVSPKPNERVKLVCEPSTRTLVVHTQLVKETRVKHIVQGCEHHLRGRRICIAVNGLKLRLSAVGVECREMGVAFAVAVLFNE